MTWLRTQRAATGKTGAPGPAGKSGPQGPAGKDGSPGKDGEARRLSSLTQECSIVIRRVRCLEATSCVPASVDSLPSSGSG